MNSFRSLFFILLMCLVGTVDAQEWTPYQSPQQINDLVDTGEELLMATDAGLVVMNKTTLEKTIFNTTNSNLPSNHIQAITIDPNGLPYIGTYDMVMALFDGSDFSDFISPDEGFSQYTELYDIEIHQNGDIWIGTSVGIFHRQGQNWLLYDEEELSVDFFRVWDIEINDNGEVFAGAAEIFKYASGEWSNISEGTELEAYLHAELFFASNGDLYFAGDLEGIGRYDGTQWHEIDNGGLNGSQAIGFAEDTAGNIYYNTMLDGVFKLEENAWVQWGSTQAEMFDNKTSYFYIDEQNQIWLNNNIYLSVGENGLIQSTTISDNTLEYNNIDKIRKTEEGDLYFLRTYGNKVYILNHEGNWSLLELPTSTTRDILPLASNDIWVSSFEGLYHFNGIDWTFNNIGSCGGFAINSQGTIHLLANNRVHIINNSVITEYNTSNSPLSSFEAISGIGVDSNDNLWIASFSWEGGAMIQKVNPNGMWTSYSKADYPAINQPRGGFYFEENGTVWIPSGQAGAIKFDGTTWSNPVLENQNSIENNKTYAIESDANGTLYFSHQYGVTTYSDGEWGNLNVTSVPEEATSSGTDIEFDDEGVLWWGSSRYGLFSYTPEITTNTTEEFIKDLNVSAYPNPADDHFTLDFEITKSADVSAIIYNNLGQQLAQFDLGKMIEGSYQQRIDVSYFSRGFYIVRLNINDDFYAIEMILK